MFVVIDRENGNCIMSCQFRQDAELQCESNDAYVVEMSDDTDIHCKKYIDNEVVDNVEMLQDWTLNNVRAQRNQILNDVVDPLMTNIAKFNELTEAEQQAWLQYRKDLLNVPQQVGFPFNVEWPVVPNDQKAITE